MERRVKTLSRRNIDVNLMLIHEMRADMGLSRRGRDQVSPSADSAPELASTQLARESSIGQHLGGIVISGRKLIQQPIRRNSITS